MGRRDVVDNEAHPPPKTVATLMSKKHSISKALNCNKRKTELQQFLLPGGPGILGFSQVLISL